MTASSPAKVRRKANAADERLFDRELEDLPAEMRWRGIGKLTELGA